MDYFLTQPSSLHGLKTAQNPLCTMLLKCTHNTLLSFVAHWPYKDTYKPYPNLAPSKCICWTSFVTVQGAARAFNERVKIKQSHKMSPWCYNWCPKKKKRDTLGLYTESVMWGYRESQSPASIRERSQEKLTLLAPSSWTSDLKNLEERISPGLWQQRWQNPKQR